MGKGAEDRSVHFRSDGLALSPAEYAHLLTRLARGQPLPMEWVLIVLASVVVAPILEELLFRGVLQGWSAGRPWGPASHRW